MEQLGNYLKSCIKKEGKTLKWVAEKLGIHYKTFVGKLNRNSITADELLKISTLLDINLENTKKHLGYESTLNNEKAKKRAESNITNNPTRKSRLAGNVSLIRPAK